MPDDSTAILPNFCTGSRVIRVLLVCEIVAVILALGDSSSADPWRRLFLLSVYLQWIGVFSAAALCLIRRHAARLPGRTVVALSYVGLLLVTLAITEITFMAGRYTGFGPIIENSSQASFAARSLGICAVVAAIGLRYFWLRASWAANTESEMRARLEALQARIEPHFLFNTLNSVAALIEPRPQAAETALEDLSTLLRARLDTQAPSAITLANEMALVEAYVRIQKLRLGERLSVDIELTETARAARLPPLCLQPLVENAIGHGVARLAAGGTVRLRARLQDTRLHIEVRNPVVGEAGRAAGHRQALANIERRLALIYDGAARLDFAHDDTWFTVTLELPQSEVALT